MLPAPNSQRIESIDILRGIAVLGIFAINVQSMALSDYVFAEPGLDAALMQDGLFWLRVATTWFAYKFITIFSALFGAGIVMMLGEDDAPGARARHYRRMLWLFAFGVLHAFALWYGDILAPYAVAGSIAVMARRWRPRSLLAAGAILILIGVMFMAPLAFSGPGAPEDVAAGWGEWKDEAQDLIDDSEAVLRASWPARVVDTAPLALAAEGTQMIAMAPRTIALMLAGMALFKLGFFTLRWRARSYLIAACVSLPVGVYGSGWATDSFVAHQFDMTATGSAQIVQYFASLPHAFGYAALVMLATKLWPGARAFAPFAAAGRMALTNYLGCSVIGALIFYGPPGVGLIGTLGFGAQAALVAATWAAILIVSPLWLARFRYGPMEWLWRSLTYGRAQPMRVPR